mmetsp:Transcript_1953/g.2869  ORF Transcript_1953/g.2869 Transcript_1953/m.2869 type:complete len:130 (+) Transcript_1953:5099-5488(+)
MRQQPEEDEIDESVPEDQEKTPKDEMSSPEKDEDDNVISMEHSDDLVDSHSHNLRGGTDEKAYKMRHRHTDEKHIDDMSGDPNLTGMDEQYTDDIGEIMNEEDIGGSKEEEEEEYEIDNLIQEDAIMAL